MEINEQNKELFDSAFIAGGEYASCIKTPTWKPGINESEIEEHCSSEDEDGNEIWIPATPLGYRDYKESKAEGLKLLFNQPVVMTMTSDEAYEIEKDKESFKIYDHVIIDDQHFIITGNDDHFYFITSEDDSLYSCEYKS